MFMICNKICERNIGLIFIILTISLSVLQYAGAQQQTANRRVQRRFMWNQMDSSMDNIMSNVMSGARAFKDMLDGMLPTSQHTTTTHTYKGNLDSLPTSTVRVRYIVRPPISTSTHTKYRFPKPTKTVKETKHYMANVTEKYKRERAPMHYMSDKEHLKYDDMEHLPYFQNMYTKSNRKNSKIMPSSQQSEIIIGKTYHNWTPIPKTTPQPNDVGTWHFSNASTYYTSMDYGEQLPEPEKLIATTTAATTYEVTEHSPDASTIHEHKYVYETTGGFIPVRSTYNTNDNATPKLKIYSERLKNSKLTHQHSSTQHRTAKSTSNWLPITHTVQSTKPHTFAPRAQSYSTSTPDKENITTTPTTAATAHEHYTKRPPRVKNKITETTTQPPATRNRYKASDLTQRGNIKFGDKLTDIDIAL